MCRTDHSYNYAGALLPTIRDKIHGIPALGFGTAGLGDRTRELTELAVELGFELIDTAQAEEWYRERDIPNDTSALVITKIHPRSYKDIRSAVERSPRTDIVLLHAPKCWPGHCNGNQRWIEVDWKSAWVQLLSLGFPVIGVSNFGVEQLEELLLLGPPPSIVQNWMDPFHHDNSTRKFCSDHGIAFQAFSPLGSQWGGRLSVLSDPTILSISSETGLSSALVILSWVIQSNAMVLTRTSKSDHLLESSSLIIEGGFLLGVLTRGQIARINSIYNPGI